ncbi:MAG: zinc ribbon domain-containing protein [Lachnospiraceae bacterium]|nr:zinc ribbon domain-containing protein [Lachnospiraceae bacterium]
MEDNDQKKEYPENVTEIEEKDLRPDVAPENQQMMMVYAGPGGFNRKNNSAFPGMMLVYAAPPLPSMFQQQQENKEPEKEPEPDPSMCFCSACGAKIPRASRFCPYCGYKNILYGQDGQSGPKFC